MKVLVVTHDSNFSGGANRSLFANLCELRDKYGIDFLVLIPSKKGQLNEKLDEVGIKWISTKYFGVVSSIRNDGKDILRRFKVIFGYYIEKFKSIIICKKIKKENIELVYTNTRLPMIGANIAKKLNVPHVVHVREFGSEKPLWGKWGFKTIEKHSNKIILISKALEKQFLENDVNKEKLIVSYNGIKYEENTYIEKTINNKVDIVIVGRLVPDKGQKDAIFAIKEIIDKKLIKEEICLHIVGSSPKRMHIKWYEEELKELVKELHLENNVIFEGEINNISEFRKNMDIELVCSIRETFGRVTIEAMRSSLFVIGSNTGGTVELIDDKETGLLYQQGDFIDLSQKIITAVIDKKLFKNVRKKAYNYALNNFTVEKNCEEIYRVIKNTYEKEK